MNNFEISEVEKTCFLHLTSSSVTRYAIGWLCASPAVSDLQSVRSCVASSSSAEPQDIPNSSTSFCRTLCHVVFGLPGGLLTGLWCSWYACLAEHSSGSLIRWPNHLSLLFFIFYAPFVLFGSFIDCFVCDYMGVSYGEDFL